MQSFLSTLVIAGLFFLSSCNPSKNNTTDNTTVLGYPSAKPENKIGEKVIYEVSLDKSDEHPSWLQYLDKDKLVNQLMDKIESGQLKAYDDHLSTKPLTLNEVRNEIKASYDTLEYNDSITNEPIKEIIEYPALNRQDIRGLLFIENWYFDNDSITLKKDFLGIGLVKYYYKKRAGDLEETLYKDLLFVVYFDKKKPI